MTGLPKKNRESLKNLAILLKIPIKYGWKTALGQAMGVDQATISKWISRGISKDGIETAEDMGFPTDLWLVPIKPYMETIGYTGIPKTDLSPGSENTISIPEPPDQFAIAVSALKEIFDSGDPVLIATAHGNIRALLHSMHRGYEIHEQSEKIRILEDTCDALMDRFNIVEIKMNSDPTPEPAEKPINKKPM